MIGKKPSFFSMNVLNDMIFQQIMQFKKLSIYSIKVSHKLTFLKCGQVLKKNELLLKMLPKLFFFRILVFFYFWGIRNRELILDRFFLGLQPSKFVQKNETYYFYLKEEKLGSLKMTTLPKQRSTFDFVYENVNSFFLEFKASSCTLVVMKPPKVCLL